MSQPLPKRQSASSYNNQPPSTTRVSNCTSSAPVKAAGVLEAVGPDQNLDVLALVLAGQDRAGRGQAFVLLEALGLGRRRGIRIDRDGAGRQDAQVGVLGQFGSAALCPVGRAALQASRNQTLSMVDFKNSTADILGPPVLTPEIQGRYLELTDDFLGQARAALVQPDSAGAQVAIDRWQQLMRRVGRRAGHALDKQVLDILSYECRAAFHRCYSAVWWDLIPRLTLKYHLSPANQRFLHFWHLDHCSESAKGRHALFHLFHGHIFALHPASAALLQSPTGRSLVGAWLTEPESEMAFGRLLHALLVVLHRYAEQRETGAGSRRNQPIFSNSDAILHIEEAIVGNLKRRRRVRTRPTYGRAVTLLPDG